MEWMSRLAFGCLVVWSFVMLCWGIFGFIEYYSGRPFVLPLQNPDFPPGTQFLHWLLISLCGIAYLAGYMTRSRYTPNIMVVIYACLATMCFIQTFDFMTDADRYVRYAMEVVLYLGISLFLFRSKRMQAHFRRREIA